MEEAVEICKLRLFLKLAAQVEPDSARDNLGIEPLPDIDFNIRAGNTLVGYASLAELKKSMEGGSGQPPVIVSHRRKRRNRRPRLSQVPRDAD